MRGAKRLMSSTQGMSQVDRYGRISDFVRDQIIAEVVRQLGPIGGLLTALIRPTGRRLTDDIAKEVDAAAQILQEIIGPPERPDWMRTHATPPGGGGRVPPSVTTPAPAPGPGPERGGIPEGQVERQVGGRRYTYDENDPIVTGAMIDVISSNVHSIGYDWNSGKGTLKVRFLEKTGRKSRTRTAGPLYYYYNVHPEVFMAFQHAASKGKFVWDRLRVRGSVSGARYFYELAETGATSYVPRKATRVGPNEYYLRRDHNGRQSDLEDEFVQRIGLNRHGPQGFVPNRGTPNRGRPNRGR
jgi:hypothetical protein